MVEVESCSVISCYEVRGLCGGWTVADGGADLDLDFVVRLQRMGHLSCFFCNWRVGIVIRSRLV